MKCQIMFSGKNKENISRCHLLKILRRVLHVSVKGLLSPYLDSSIAAKRVTVVNQR